MDNTDKWAAECYRKGNDAMQKQNWDLAVEMFSTCVKMKPQFLNYRQLLRRCTQLKYNDNGKGAGTMAGMKLMGIRSKAKKALSAKEWKELDSAAEEGLILNPWDVELNRWVAEANVNLDRTEIARFAYQLACKSAPKDKHLWMTWATLLRDRGEYQEAIKVAQQVQKIDSNDPSIKKFINDCDVQSTTHRGGYDDAANTKDVKVNKGTPARPGELVAPGQSQEMDLRHAIRKEPDKIEHYLKLADYLKRNRKLLEARETLSTALQISGNDANVREQVEDVELLLLQANVDTAREKAAESGSEDLRKQAAELSIELRNRKIEVLSSREARYPSNLGLKLELAQLQMQLQKWSVAIPLLQKASQDPRLKVKALVSLGKCFMYDKKLPLARSQFERAIPDLNVEQDVEQFKEAHYLLARICEELGDTEKAVSHFGEVLVIDYEYKDARERLERLQGG